MFWAERDREWLDTFGVWHCNGQDLEKYKGFDKLAGNRKSVYESTWADQGCGYFSWVQPMPPMPSKKERFSKLFSDELSGTTESKVLVRLQRELQQHQKHVETCCERASFVADLSGIMFPIGSWAPAFLIPDLPVPKNIKELVGSLHNPKPRMSSLVVLHFSHSREFQGNNAHPMIHIRNVHLAYLAHTDSVGHEVLWNSWRSWRHLLPPNPMVLWQKKPPISVTRWNPWWPPCARQWMRRRISWRMACAL